MFGLPTRMLLTAAAAQLTVSAQAESSPKPVCTSCAAWCEGTCSFEGPPLADGAANPRTRQNVTIYRMTAANVTDLDDKDTGNPAGDLVFNMDERAIPLVCRHSATASKNPDCVEGNTHSWLLDSNLVYLQWVIEVDGAWGPYQMCNMNLTNPKTGQPGDGKWFCDGARFDGTNFTDRELCSTCDATKKAVGWSAMNASASKPAWKPRIASAECNATFTSVCATESANYTACHLCGSRNYKVLKANCKNVGVVESTHCPLPPPASAACAAAATALCGDLRKPALRHNCSECLENHSHALAMGPCPDGQIQSLMMYNRSAPEHDWCPASASGGNLYNSKSNATWLGPQQLHPNHRLVAKTLGGSWFSTTTGGRCAEGERPGDGGSSGCTWRPVALKKAVNYSCVQANVAATVLSHGKTCFGGCATDGHNPNPVNPSDCWLRCFFNSFIGNSTLGLVPMSRDPLLKVWAQSFTSDDIAEGGCPPVSHTPPPYPPVAAAAIGTQMP